MSKTKPTKSRETKLAEMRLRRRKKYEEIKNDPEKYAIQKEKERMRYLKRKEQKKIKCVADMTPREKRLQRKKWKENSQRYAEKKKTNRRVQELMLQNTPPSSDREDSADVAPQQDPLEGPSHQAQDMITKTKNCRLCEKKNNLLRKLCCNQKKQIGKLKQEKEKIEKERNAMKRMLNRIIKKNRIQQAQIEPSTEQKVDKIVETVDSDKREEVKKQLLFGEVVSRNLSEGFSGLRKKEKRVFSDIVLRNKESFKKHKILGKSKKFTVRDKNITQRQDLENSKFNIQQQIEDFFEDDANTNVSPEKNEFITRNGVRKQKRYLTDTLNNLYKKFENVQNGHVAYSTFCRYRPFWILFPKESNRNTCACKVHVNFDLLVKSLNKHKIIREANGTALLKSLCCDIYNERCLSRICDTCKIRVVNFQQFNNENMINYYEWCAKKENYTVKGEDKTKIVRIKTKTQDYPKNVIEKLQKSLNLYFNHSANILAQQKHLKTLKSTLTTMEAIVHLDFSENYSVKFNEEVQSFHFGGSRTQITLHTSVVYVIDPDTGIVKPYSVCSISECNQHDARAIWAHLIPLLSYIQEITPQIDTIHFISDSPSSQYRNRYMFYVIGQLQQDFPELKYITWNYLEAGHGKGAPDGVGAVLKRTADQIVRLGKDIGTIEEFWNQIRGKVKNIKLLSVSEQDVQEKSFPTEVQAFRGTMSVHQVLWSYNCPLMTLRKLSCFFCENGVTCTHGYHLGFIKLPPAPENESLQLEDFLNKNATGSFLKEVVNSLNPDPQLDSEFNQTQQLSSIAADDVTLNMQASSSSITQSKAITVLSDIKLHWSNKAFIQTNKNISIPKCSQLWNLKKGIGQHKTQIKIAKKNYETPKKETAKPANASSDDIRYGEYKTRTIREKARSEFQDMRKDRGQMKENIRNYFCDSSDDDIF